MKNHSLKTLVILFAMVSFTFTGKIQAQHGGGNADGSYTGETGYGVTTGQGSQGGNCGHGPNQHAGNANCNKGGTSVPLDGGLSILLFGAAAFGIKKLRESKK